MSGVGLPVLVPDILIEIMRELPSDIDQKFAVTQVSRYWRNVALQDHLYWSSFTGGASKADCYRIPIILERSGSATLHIRLSFSDGHTPLTDAHTYAMEALVPHVARIETLHVKFWVYPHHTLSLRTVQALLNSGLEFPALTTLRLEGPEYGPIPSALLTAPQLRTLHVERFNSASWVTLLSPSLETITLSSAGNTSAQTLLDIFDRCRRAWRVVLRYGDSRSHYPDDFFEAFTRQRPLAPALRELELATPDSDLDRILAGFSNVVLDTITCHSSNSRSILRIEDLMFGLGPLVVFDLTPNMRQLELHDNDGHVRRLQCWEEDSWFEIHWVWGYLCDHYHLHETVREIRISHWDGVYFWNQYAKSFQRYPPQLPDGITLVFAASYFSFSTEGEEDSDYIPRTMSIPGLAHVDFQEHWDRSTLSLKSVLRVLAHIEPPPARQVEVCIHSMTLLSNDTEKDMFDVFQAALSKDSWTICTQCMHQSVH